MTRIAILETGAPPPALHAAPPGGVPSVGHAAMATSQKETDWGGVRAEEGARRALSLSPGSLRPLRSPHNAARRPPTSRLTLNPPKTVPTPRPATRSPRTGGTRTPPCPGTQSTARPA